MRQLPKRPEVTQISYRADIGIIIITTPAPNEAIRTEILGYVRACSGLQHDYE